MKSACWILAIIFTLFALVQYNDPDPMLWILLYGSVAVHFVLAAYRKLYLPAVWVTLLVAIGWAIVLVPEFINWVRMGTPTIVDSMQAEAPWIEFTREFLGLVLVAGACVFLLRTNKSRE